MSGPLDGYVIALVGRLTLVGKLDLMCRELRPVYQLDTYALRAPLAPGEIGLGRVAGFMREALPMLSFSSIRGFPIGDAPVYSVMQLSLEEQRALLRCIEGCEELMMKTRAAEAGLTIETKIPQIDARGIARG